MPPIEKSLPLTFLHYLKQMDQSPSTAQQLTFNKQVLPLPASTGHTENSVRSNLERGASIDTKHDKCVSLLQWTTDGEDMAPVTVKFPIKWGCDADSADERRLTPLHWHAAMTETTAVQELIRKGEPKSVVAGTFGTPLHQAASKGHVETVVAMLEEGCPINEVDSGNRTVLHWAAKTGYVEVVRELVSRGCDVNAVQANGSTPLHTAALFGRTEVARELVKLGASKSIIAGGFGTPLHQAIAGGHTEVVKVLLNDELCETDLTNDNAAPSKWQPSNCNVIDTCDAYGQTPMMWALKFGRLELLRLLISKGGDIPGKDIHNMSALEQCFVGGQASRLSQFCEACGIRGSNKGLRDILAALIAQGLVDPCKVLCLCAISGDSIFLEDQFIELVASGACAMPAAVKCAKYYFEKGDHFRAKFRVGDDSELNPLQMALLSLICFKMGFPVQSVKRGAKDHTLFIRKLLSHSVLKKTVNQYFPNGLTPLDLAQHFEFHHIATLIEKAGGRPGVWGGIPRAVFSAHFSELFMVTSSLMKLCDSSQGGHESVKEAMIKILGGQTVESVVHVADDNQLVKEQVLDQHPNMGDIVKHVLPHIQMRHWKKVGLSLGIKKNTLGELGQQFSSDDDCYLETLSYWLEHGSSVTWKTLLDVLGYFETWHTVDELTDKIVSVLGGGHQVSVQVLCIERKFNVVWRRQVVLSCHVCMCLSCFLFLSGGNC